jgi:hypothetical protein
VPINEIISLADKIIATQPRGEGIGGTDGILETARQLETTAGLTSDPATAALALIRRGDALRAELHYRQEIIAPDAINTAVAQARAAYEQAIEKACQAVRDGKYHDQFLVDWYQGGAGTSTNIERQ